MTGEKTTSANNPVSSTVAAAHGIAISNPGTSFSLRDDEAKAAWIRSSVPAFFQPKLTVGPPDDSYEQEADSISGKVMRMKEGETLHSKVSPVHLQRTCVPCGNPSSDVPMKTTPGAVQRKCEQCEKEAAVQRKGLRNGTTSIETPSIVHDALNSAGQSMDGETQSFMESRFGYNFSDVRIHTGTVAAASAESINAFAYTSGNNIVFNEGQYSPGTDGGKRLLAHELTHVVQQSGGNGAAIQRAPLDSRDRIHDPLEEAFSRDTGIPRGQASHHNPEYEDWLRRDENPREMVDEAISFLNSSTSFYQEAVVNESLVDRLLSGWQGMAEVVINLIQTRLNSSAALLQEFKTAFNAAVRSLFTRAASTIPNNTIIRLYLSNLYRLPEWAWPGVAGFNFTSDSQRNTFITGLTSAFNDHHLFQGFTTIDETALRSILTNLFTLITDSQQMIAHSLNNDPAVLDPLQSAYRTAVDRLLNRAGTHTGQSAIQLFMRYRYGSAAIIHEWADQQISGITGAAPLGTSADPLTGDVVFNHNGFRITLQPDGTHTGTGAVTNLDMQYTTSIGRNWDGNIITSFTPPRVPAITIQTLYNPASPPGTRSEYGRGTTAGDIRLGNTSLGYHERSHSRDYLRYIENHPAPVFTGAVGMTKRDFSVAADHYYAAMEDYIDQIERTSELATDCVGSPNIVQHHTAGGTVSEVSCP